MANRLKMITKKLSSVNQLSIQVLTNLFGPAGMLSAQVKILSGHSP